MPQISKNVESKLGPRLSQNLVQVCCATKFGPSFDSKNVFFCFFCSFFFKISFSLPPVNDPNLNGTHPALLAALRCNSDVQIPFRFPVTSLTHSDQKCPDDCPKGCRIRDIIKEAQTNQAAQAGYACDYQNKRSQRAGQ